MDERADELAVSEAVVDRWKSHFDELLNTEKLK